VTEPRPASLGDADLLARIAAEGFYADPVLSWALPDDAARLHQLTVVFRGLVEDTLPDRGVVHLVADASAAFWRDPSFEHGRTASDRLEDSGQAGSEEDPGPFSPADLDRLTILGDAMREAHPHDPPHWYLNVVATLPSHQSRGLGGAVLQPVLARADEEGAPCYLESTNPRNRTLYYRAGFEDLEEIQLDGGPVLLQMWREPRTG
jgi:GNAT superfamily N-acetyltransferase